MQIVQDEDQGLGRGGLAQEVDDTVKEAKAGLVRLELRRACKLRQTRPHFRDQLGD